MRGTFRAFFVFLAAATIGVSQANAVVISDDGQIDQFLHNVYHDLLNRAPDLLGQTTFHAALKGGMDTGALGSAFLASGEYRHDLITGFFNSFLHRAPDTGDYAAFADLAQWPLMEAILTSGEYRTAHPGADAYVQSLYHDVLGRPSDPSSLAFWISYYNSHSDVSGIADSLITSMEYRTDLVTGFYHHLLHRAPDAPGLAFFVNDFGTPESVEAQFIGSVEYLTVQSVAGIPELSTWAMMLIGFSGVGLQMRHRGRAVATAA